MLEKEFARHYAKEGIIRFMDFALMFIRQKSLPAVE